MHMSDYKMGFLNMFLSDIANRIVLVLLATRRMYNDIVFTYKLLNGVVDGPDFCHLLILSP